jgi:hypothetical protein
LLHAAQASEAISDKPVVLDDLQVARLANLKAYETAFFYTGKDTAWNVVNPLTILIFLDTFQGQTGKSIYDAATWLAEEAVPSAKDAEEHNKVLWGIRANWAFWDPYRYSPLEDAEGEALVALAIEKAPLASLKILAYPSNLRFMRHFHQYGRRNAQGRRGLDPQRLGEVRPGVADLIKAALAENQLAEDRGTPLMFYHRWGQKVENY